MENQVQQLRQQFKTERQTEQQRIREYNSLPDHVGTPYTTSEVPNRYSINLQLTEDQYSLMEEALDLLIKQSNGYRQRAINNPSESIKSILTQERQQKRINQLEDIKSRLSENAW